MVDEAERGPNEVKHARMRSRGVPPPALHFYEFRILTKAGNISAATQEAHISDNLAVRSARLLARGEAFEVWRGITCVHPVQTTSR